MTRFTITALALTVVALTACKRGPDFEPPAPETPERYRSELPSGESVANTDWWDLYQDTVLQELIRRGLENNRSIREAMARIQEVRAGVTIARSEKYPTVNGIGLVAVQPDAGDEDSLSVIDNVRLIGAASYEVDLWGRVARSNEAAAQGLLATEEAFRTVTISLVSQIASTYLQLRDIDARIEITEGVIATNQSSYELMATRAEGGLVAEVDLRRQEIDLADSEAVLAQLRRARGQAEHGLSLLVGELPQDVARGASLADQDFPPAVPAGLPSELLQRRPDILAAERALHAQTARIGVAEANRFPKLSLTSNFGGKVTSQGTATVTGLFLNLGANILAPIYNAGALKAATEVERARTLQVLNQYEQVVLNAFREVEDALVSVETYRLEHEARVRQAAAARAALSSVQVLYDGGLVSLQEVLDLQKGVFGADLQTSAALQQHHTAIVRLYQALGGGWSPIEVETTADGADELDGVEGDAGGPGG